MKTTLTILVAIIYFISAQANAATQSSLGIARDIIEHYDNNKKRIDLVADNADYAVLAWAAYGSEEALNSAKKRGWTLLRPYSDNNLIVGDTAAILFDSDKGQHVLAFRGTQKAGDWVTNINGTLSVSPIALQQIEGAKTIARSVATKHPDVVFVGHSLGGRLAHVARLETKKPAVVFNTAPLGRGELKQAFGKKKKSKAALVAFKSPEDPLSSLFSPKDIEVSNVVRIKGGSVVDTVNADYTHSISVIANAMQQVRLAKAEGWLADYRAQNIYSDIIVEFALPLNFKLIEQQKCDSVTMRQLSRALTNFRCSKVSQMNKEHLILKNTGPASSRLWQYRVVALGDQPKDLGDIDAEHTIVPVLVDGSKLELLAVKIDRPAFTKKGRKVSYERYQVGENGLSSFSLASNDVRSGSGPAASAKPTKPAVTTQSANSTKSAHSEPVQVTSSATAPPASPPIDVIEKAVRDEIQNNVPGRWIGMTIPGRRAQFQLIEIIKWGKVSERNGLQVFPVRVRVAGRAITDPPFGRPSAVKFDDVAEFRFVENDFSEWEHVFKRPGIFGD